MRIYGVLSADVAKREAMGRVLGPRELSPANPDLNLDRYRLAQSRYNDGFYRRNSGYPTPLAAVTPPFWRRLSPLCCARSFEEALYFMATSTIRPMNKIGQINDNLV